MPKNKKEEKEILAYTLVLHQARKHLNITHLQYCVADCIYHLSNNPNSQIKGWCYASKEYIGNFLGVSSQSIFDALKHLLVKNIVQKNPESRQFLRTTEVWYNAVILKKLQSRKTLDNQGFLIKQSRVSSDSNQGFLMKQSRVSYDNNNNISKIDKDKDNKGKKEKFDLALFEKFYKLYPKKVGKKNTLIQWKIITVKERQKIMLDVPKRMNDKKWTEGFIKDPERYIKHRQWEDEINKVKKGVSSLML